MALLRQVSIGLKGFAAFWALITFAVAAALQAKLNAWWGDWNTNNSNYAGANVIIAAGVFGFLYFTAALIFLLVRPDSIFLSLIADTSIIGFLFILSLAGTATESSKASTFSNCDLDLCSLGSATIGLGWVFTFLLLGILLFEVIYTIMHYGTSYATWRTPFNQLLYYGTSGRRNPGVSSNDAPPPVPMSTVNQHTYASSNNVPPPVPTSNVNQHHHSADVDVEHVPTSAPHTATAAAPTGNVV